MVLQRIIKINILIFVSLLLYFGCSTVRAKREAFDAPSPKNNSSCKLHYDSPRENPKCYKLQDDLITASAHGDIQTISEALDAGANIEGTVDASYPALYTASMLGQYDAVSLLLKKGAQINRVLTFGKTTLKAAVLAQKPALVKLLIEKGADVCDMTPDEGLALDIAKRKENKEIIKMLSDAGGENCN